MVDASDRDSAGLRWQEKLPKEMDPKDETWTSRRWEGCSEILKLSPRIFASDSLGANYLNFSSLMILLEKVC